MFRVSFTHTILFYIREFLLHAPCYFMWELHTPCCVMWGVSLTHLMLFYVGSFSYPMLFYVGSFSYTRHAILCGEFLLQAPCYFMWGVSLTCPILLYVGVVVFTRPILCYVGSFSYISHSLLCGEFLRCILHLLLEEWQTNARTRSVGWSLRTTPQIKPVSWSHGYFALVLAGCSCCGHRLLCFHHGRHSCLDLPSAQTPGRQRLRANIMFLTTSQCFCLTSFSYPMLCGEFLLHVGSLFYCCYFGHVGNFSYILFYV